MISSSIHQEDVIILNVALTMGLKTSEGKAELRVHMALPEPQRAPLVADTADRPSAGTSTP